MINSFERVFVVFGPTASGKSSLALKIASSQNGEIINADSLQIYNTLHKLTSQPSIEERNEIKHHLYSSLEPDEHCSVGIWLKLVTKKISEVIENKKIPIIVGGTGMYISALLNGINHIPQIPEEIRQESQLKLEQLNILDFYEQLLQIDPKIKGKISKYDSQRILRAYEVKKSTGISITDWWKNPNRNCVNYNFCKIFINPPRNDLYNQCNKRFVDMVNSGIIEEIIDLKNQYKDLSQLGIYKAIGVREILSMLENKTSIDMMIEFAQKNTRNYAKRQVTWFKNQINSDLIIDQIEEKPKNEMLEHYLNKLA